MREVGGPLAEVGEHRRLDGLDSFRLFRVVGDPMFRAVGVRHKQRPLAVVAAAGAHRFAFFLPRRAAEASAPCSGVLTGPACFAAASCVPGRTFTRCSRVVAQSFAFWGLTEHLLNWQSAVPCARPQASCRFSHV